MSIMSNAKRALAIAAAAATLLSMAACGSSNAASGKSDSSGAASSGKIEVVASINQWGSVAEDLGGSKNSGIKILIVGEGGKINRRHFSLVDQPLHHII